MRKSSLFASALLAAAAIGAGAMPAGIALAKQPSANHRRAAGGPTNALKIRRAARKARNVQRNRKAHRG